MNNDKEKLIENAVDSILGMDTGLDPQTADSAHCFGHVFRVLQNALNELKESGMETGEVYDCMNKAVGRIMTRTNGEEGYDYMVALIQRP